MWMHKFVAVTEIVIVDAATADFMYINVTMKNVPTSSALVIYATKIDELIKIAPTIDASTVAEDSTNRLFASSVIL